MPITEGLANAWLNTLRNIPFVVPGTFIQLHKGVPGPEGMANLSAVTDRAQVNFSAGIDGKFAITGAAPSWVMTAPETLTHITVWSSLTDITIDSLLWSEALLIPRTVAAGDPYSHDTCNVTLKELLS